MRTAGLHGQWPDVRSPGSRSRSVCTCQVLRPRRAAPALALARSCVLPSAETTASAPGIILLSRLNGWPMHSPADASDMPSRAPPHGSGPVWLATPSLQRTSTSYSLPVSRRTVSKECSRSRQRACGACFEAFPDCAGEAPQHEEVGGARTTSAACLRHRASLSLFLGAQATQQSRFGAAVLDCFAFGSQ
jgi:hypothetical protein